MVALATAALRHGVLPRSAAYMLIVAAAVLLFLTNFEDDRVLSVGGQAAVLDLARVACADPQTACRARVLRSVRAEEPCAERLLFESVARCPRRR